MYTYTYTYLHKSWVALDNQIAAICFIGLSQTLTSPKEEFYEILICPPKSSKMK